MAVKKIFSSKKKSSNGVNNKSLSIPIIIVYTKLHSSGIGLSQFLEKICFNSKTSKKILKWVEVDTLIDLYKWYSIADCVIVSLVEGSYQLTSYDEQGYEKIDLLKKLGLKKKLLGFISEFHESSDRNVKDARRYFITQFGVNNKIYSYNEQSRDKMCEQFEKINHYDDKIEIRGRAILDLLEIRDNNTIQFECQVLNNSILTK